MPFRVSIQPGGQQFDAAEDTTILQAALDAGFLLPYGCRDGACGSCKGRILEGSVDYGKVSPTTLTDTDKKAGLALFCCAKPRSDVVLESKQITHSSDIPVKKLPCRVQRLEKVASDVMILELKLPASEQFRFRAGQYIDFLLPGNRRRSFSIANAPEAATHLELHVRRIEGGTFTGQVFEQMKEKDILRFEGPLGSFFLREESTKPIVLLAGGTGFAPIKSIVEHVLKAGLKRSMILYWGARNLEGLYLDDLAAKWEQMLPGFKYVPVLSDMPADLGWKGRTGLVHEAVMADLPDLSAHQVYACGAPAMIEAAQADFFEKCALPREEFFADAFTYAADATI